MDMNEHDLKDKGDSAPKHWKSEQFKAKEKELPYKYMPAVKRREFIDNLQKKMSRFRGPEPILPENVKAEIGHLLVYILKEVLTIENKYGYKVPLLSS